MAWWWLLPCQSPHDRSFSPLTLRFHSPQIEVAFASRQIDTLVARVRFYCILGFVIAIGVGCIKIIWEKVLTRHAFHSEAAFHSARMSMFCLIVLVFLPVAALVALHFMRMLGNVRPAICETMVTIVFIAFMVLAVLRQPAYMGKLMGYSISEAVGDKYLSDSSTLMVIDGVITAVHIGFPMRWCSLVPLQVSGILLYVMIVSVVGSFETPNDNAYSIFFLVFLVVVASVGKRATEVSQRQAFLDIIEQKRLRCRAEFELSKVKRVSIAETAMQDVHSQSKRNSTHETTMTNRIFDVFDDEVADSAEQLETIKQLGNAEHWCIQEHEVKLLHNEVLGTGSYGQVMKGVFCGTVVAVKAPHDKLKASHLRRLPALCNELRILRRVRHSGIVTFHGATISPADRRIALVMEFVRGPVLREVLLCGDKELGTFQRYQLMLGVCNALFYLHTRQPPIVHGDLKATNVLVESANDSMSPKLLDFGLSRALSHRPRRLGGTLAWMAPEVFRSDSPVKCSADVYSFGRLTSFIATSIEPMSGLSIRKIKTALAQGRPPLPAWPSGCAFETKIKALVHSCLRAGESERPFITQVHARLLRLAQELNFLETHGHLLEEVQLLGEHSGPGTPHPDTADGSEVSEMSLLSEPGNEDLDLSPSRHRLPPLAEDEPETRSPGKRRSSQRHAHRLSRLHPFPNCVETSQEAMMATLDHAIRRWNISLPLACCCEMHARMNVLLRLCQLEMGRPCRCDHPQPIVPQCPECGLLSIASACDACGWEASDEIVTNMAL